MRYGRLMTVLAATAVVAACSPSSGAETATPADSAKPAAGAKKVTLWYLTDHAPFVKDAVERYKKDHPDIKVDAVAFANDQYKTKIKVALGTSEGPDVFHTWGGSEFAEYIKAGQVTDITGNVDSWPQKSEIGAAALKTGQVDGKQYGVPVAIEASMIWYRKDIFAKLGITPPATWDEFLTVISKVKRAGYVPLATANKTKWPGGHWWSELTTQTCGPNLVDDIVAGKPGASFKDPCFTAAFDRLKQLADVGAFNKGFNGLDYDSGESRTLFWSGKAAMNHMGNWTIGSAEAEAPKIVKDLDFFIVPSLPGAKVASGEMTGGVSPMYASSSTSKDPTAAADLIKYLSDSTTAQVVATKGVIPVVKGVSIADPLTAKVAESINKASVLAPWPNVALPAQISDVMLTVTQAVMGGDMEPAEAANKLNEVAEKVGAAS